jgi:hypothetical protein
MKTYSTAFAVLLLIAGPTAAPSDAATPAQNNTAAASSEFAARMRVLFDGTNLDAWEYDPEVWSIQDGAIRGTGKYCQMFTKDDFGSFRLLVTSRVVEPQENTGNGHLGVLFWGERPEPGKWGTAGALQVQPPHGAMWDYRTNKNVSPERVVPKQGLLYRDWHTSEVLASLPTGEVRMAVDGIEIIRYKHPDPSVLKRGPIGMQLHSAKAVMEYKDIRVEDDPQADRLISVQ